MKTRIQVSNSDGSVLVMVLVLMVVLVALTAALLSLSGNVGIEVSRDINTAKAFWAAEAGIEQAKTIGQMNRKRYPVIPRPVGSGTLLGSNVLSGGTSMGSYSVTIVNDPAWDNTAHTLQKYIITSVGTAQGGAVYVVKVHASLLNYASYLMATHLENNLYYTSGDVLDGAISSDDQLHILGPPGPIFQQRVTSASNTVDYKLNSATSWTPNTNEYNAIWQGGLVLNAPPLDIQGRFGNHVDDIQAESQLGGLTLAGSAAADYNFTFKADGSFTYSNRSTHVVKSSSLSALSGPIYVDGNVYVQGVVKGRTTLAARHAINIVTNLVYESASGTHPDPWNTNFNYAAVGDMLGLMAVDRVNVQGANSIAIHASILVTSGQFTADSWNQYLGGSKFINLFGGISQYSRGYVGEDYYYFDGHNNYHYYFGFYKNYKFDKRYISEGPPSFPPSLYSFSSWE